MSLSFYRCNICGNIIVKVHDSGMDPFCCGKTMEKLVPQKNEMLGEKHVPICKINGCRVTIHVSTTVHPSTEEHHIAWIAIETNYGFRLNYLKSAAEPKTQFELLPGESVLGIYSYCNMHDLWYSECEGCGKQEDGCC